ncbi:hypothetical protein [Mesorhizobium sp. WSM3882]|uniref:hypothetical protein n=1 Tax=Mesorhizobium sp. WSM3882 TaxID=2029407 RepID=UPI000BB05D9F|nr:hypothetical protein [Mesorhizobium sp. WSM3882]PBB34349.1 hypothetical protein CK214_08565 [Mesorhizobium sp. WSM3882]
MTTLERALSILRDGFRDGEGYYMTDMRLRGVFLSDRPLDQNEGVISDADTILAVEFGVPAILDEYEVVEEGKPYREWCVPSDFIRQFARTRIV